MQDFAKTIYLDPEIEKYIVRIVDATRHPAKYKLEHAKYIELGCSQELESACSLAQKRRQ